jgi:murein DD-endopeptidase MepM/ murein hydrolase activator NlpD
MTDLIRPVPQAITQDFDGAFSAERPGYLRTDVVPHRGKRTPFAGGRFRKDLHLGIDYNCPTGTRIKAMASGTIVRQGIDASSGNAVYICQRVHRGPNFDLLLDYYHLRTGGLLRKLGDRVTQGIDIGISGCTGWCFGDHLHVHLIRIPRGASPDTRYSGTFLDPLPFVSGRVQFADVD